MSIGRSAAFQSAQAATCLLLDAKDVATGRRKRPGVFFLRGIWGISSPPTTKKTALCDNHHSENGSL